VQRRACRGGESEIGGVLEALVARAEPAGEGYGEKPLSDAA
jgi:hypothetical protein